MKTPAIWLTIIVLFLSCVPSAQAQDSDWYIAPVIVYTDDDGDRAVPDTVTGIQVSVGRQMTDHLALEGWLGYHDVEGYVDPGESYPDQKTLDLSFNLLAYPNRDWTVAPYLLLGVGYMGVNLDPGGSDNGVSGTAGIGFQWHIGDSRYSIRGEYRIRNAKGSRATDGTERTLTDDIISLGFQYNFGAKPEPVSDDTDTDGDGVLDIWDECPATERGAQVSARGCPLRDIENDGDGDRIHDGIDECPNSPMGAPVDPYGCQLDSDGDGVMSGQDRCPASRIGAVVDAFGCERDNDNDGVVDHLDDCLDTAPNVRVDVNGCEIADIIQLPGVNFESGSDRLVPGATPVLENVAETLLKHKDLRIEVAGHTDSVGLANSNFGLSERRAITVRDFLINYGVSAGRLSAMGYGETQPIASDHDEAGRATNRRVELRIIGR